MPAVPTVTGDIDVDDLGATLMHEHVFVLSTEMQQNRPDPWDEEAEIDRAVERLRLAKSYGVDTIVDLTVLGLGRFIPRIQQVAAKTDVHILVATGLYIMNDVPFYFYHRRPAPAGPDPMTEVFVRDIETGIGDTGARAAILKCATDEAGVTPGVERVLRAVAAAHRQTGVPISTHTDGAHGNEQQDIFESEGVDLSRVIIGHSDESGSMDYLERIIGRGSFIGLDHFGVDVVPFDERVALLVKLVEAGHADHIVLSHDAPCYTDVWDMSSVNWPNWCYSHIHRDVVPELRRRGVDEAAIDQMLVANPRRIFATQGSY